MDKQTEGISIMTNDLIFYGRSDEAKRRLRWLDHHAKSKNAVLTYRYFGISESYFWKWKKRFEINRLKGLEDNPKKPKRVRIPEIRDEIIQEIDKLRRLFPLQFI